MPYVISLLPSNLSCTANEGETLLQATQRQGITLAKACGTGSCQLCEAKLISGSIRTQYYGQIQHIVGTDNAIILCCISYPTSDIKLEVEGVLAPGQLPSHEVSAQIISVEQASPDVKIIQLRLPAGKPIRFYGGQYLEVLLSAEKSAAFSIASAPRSDRSIELHIRQTTESESYNLLAPKLKTGELLRLKLPMGKTSLENLPTSTPLIMVAASTGFSQMKAILEALQGKREVHLYWGARMSHDLYLHDWMNQFSQTHPNVHYIPVVSDQPDWQGRAGLVHQAVLADIQDFAPYTVICGGSPGMVYAAYDDFLAAGMKPEQMHSDVFDYAPRDKP